MRGASSIGNESQFFAARLREANGILGDPLIAEGDGCVLLIHLEQLHTLGVLELEGGGRGLVLLNG